MRRVRDNRTTSPVTMRRVRDSLLLAPQRTNQGIVRATSRRQMSVRERPTSPIVPKLISLTTGQGNRTTVRKPTSPIVRDNRIRHNPTTIVPRQTSRTGPDNLTIVPNRISPTTVRGNQTRLSLTIDPRPTVPSRTNRTVPDSLTTGRNRISQIIVRMRTVRLRHNPTTIAPRRISRTTGRVNPTIAPSRISRIIGLNQIVRLRHNRTIGLSRRRIVLSPIVHRRSQIGPSQTVRLRHSRIIGLSPIVLSPIVLSQIVLSQIVLSRTGRPRRNQTTGPRPIVPRRTGTSLPRGSKRLRRPSVRSSARLLLQPTGRRLLLKNSNRNRKLLRRKRSRKRRSLRESRGYTAVGQKLFMHPEFFSGCFFCPQRRLRDVGFHWPIPLRILRTRAVEALAPRDRGQTEPQVPQGLPENSPPVHWRVRKEGKIRVP